MSIRQTVRAIAATSIVALTVVAPHVEAAPPVVDPLPAWNEGPAKDAIRKFVERTINPGEDYLAPNDRIAVFDNDGTLWPEQPIVQVEHIRGLASEALKKDPSLAKQPPFRAALAGDTGYFARGGEKAVMQLVTAVIVNKNDATVTDEARTFISESTYPSLGVKYTSLPYQPMLELIAYLRQNRFDVWISTGGGIDFVRAIAPTLYGVQPDHVIGSSLKKTFVIDEGEPILKREPQIGSINDGANKAVNIDLHIGARPAFASGNVRSGGDIAMLAYSQGRPGPSLQLLIHHDDPAREFAYDEKDSSSLGAAALNGWTVVSMKSDWRTVFADPRAKPIAKNQ